MTHKQFLKVLYEAIKDDHRFDKIEFADKPGSTNLRIYPFDGPPLIITVKEEVR